MGLSVGWPEGGGSAARSSAARGPGFAEGAPRPTRRLGEGPPTDRVPGTHEGSGTAISEDGAEAFSTGASQPRVGVSQERPRC